MFFCLLQCNFFKDCRNNLATFGIPPRPQKLSFAGSQVLHPLVRTPPPLMACGHTAEELTIAAAGSTFLSLMSTDV